MTATSPVRTPAKRTIVRKMQQIRWKTLQTGVRAMSAIAPDAAAGYVADAFFKPRRWGTPVPEVPGLDARPFTVRTATGPVAAWSFGEGPAILLVHGWESCAAHLTGFVMPLVAAGRRVVVFDQPAHGASAGAAVDVFQMADAVKAVAEVVGPLEGLVAHSLGATSAGVALSLGLPVKRVAFLSPTVEPDAFAAQLAGLFGIGEERLITRIYRRLGRERGSVSLDLKVGALEASLLVLHDAEDREVPLEHGRRIAAAWPGATLELVEGVGHRRILRDAKVIARVTRHLLAT